jgi:anti-sigma factor RsiW
VNSQQPAAEECERALAALARGGPDTEWEWVDRHLATCGSCAAGLARFTAAVEEQFAASESLQAGGTPAARPSPSGVLAFPPAWPRRRGGRLAVLQRRGVLGTLAAVAAALLVLVGVLVVRTSSGGGSVVAGRRPEFVPSLEVVPSRPDHTYYAGEQIQVCLSINQPSRVHLSVLEGQTTFDLYDADSDPGRHCFPERIADGLRSRARLRVEVFYGSQRVAREDYVLLPAAPTPSP